MVPALHLPGSIGHSTTVSAASDSGTAAGEKRRSAVAMFPQNPRKSAGKARFPQKPWFDHGSAERDLTESNGDLPAGTPPARHHLQHQVRHSYDHIMSNTAVN